MTTGQWLFRWRSYLPLVVLAGVLVVVVLAPVPMGGVTAIPAWSAAGILIGCAGYGFRALTLGYVARGTSSRGTSAPAAASLNTTGAYAMVRHPLYFGNFLLWMGVAVIAGNVIVLPAVALAFWVYYERIMMAEEAFLNERFGEKFRQWAARTPAFWPRPGYWVAPAAPYSLRYALGRDYQALFGLVTSSTIVEIVRRVALHRHWVPGLPWRWYFAVGTAAYFVMHGARRTGMLARRAAPGAEPRTAGAPAVRPKGREGQQPLPRRR